MNRSVVSLFSFASMLALCACGGGSSATGSAPVPIVPQAIDAASETGSTSQVSSAIAESVTSFAALGKAGPPLSPPAADLAASLTCTSNVGTSRLRPILLVPGTTLTPSVNFSWNYERAFGLLGKPWCAVTLPDSAMGDIDIAGEYVVNAIRTVAKRSHHRIDILGYSQGGMVPRWALRFWPDTRPLVQSYVALDPSNHGTADAVGLCTVGCARAIWQQETGSHFLTALNSYAETFAGIAYTVVYSDTDEVVVPNLPIASSSSLSTGSGTIANISVQSICPADVSEHLAMGSYDPVGYALALDAFDRGTVAKAADVPLSVCLTPFQPGVDPAKFVGNYATYGGYVANTLGSTPHVGAEPALPSYVYAQ